MTGPRIVVVADDDILSSGGTDAVRLLKARQTGTIPMEFTTTTHITVGEAQVITQ